MMHFCGRRAVSGVLVLLGIGFGASASAQDAGRTENQTGQHRDRLQPGAPRGPDRARPRDHRAERDHRHRRSPRRFDLRPQFQRDEFGYRFGIPAFDDLYSENTQRAYRQGLADGRSAERFEMRSERGLASYQEAMFKGHSAFAGGKYGLAARQFLLAATLNQGDAASRLCAANAHTALRDYGPAARLIRRAFELQPRLVYLPMDIRGAYGDGEDFAEHRNALREAAKRNADDGDLWFLLGYTHFYTNQIEKAARALERAEELLPDDPLVAKLAALASMSAGSSRTRSP